MDESEETVTVAHQIQFISLATEVLEKISTAESKVVKGDYLCKTLQHFRKAFMASYAGTLDPDEACVRLRS